MKRFLIFPVALAILFSVSIMGCDGEERIASFSLSNLSISSEEAYPDEIVAISVYVSNTGNAQGSYDVSLNINGVQEDTKTVSLDSYQGQSVAFAVFKQSVGTYNVAIGNLSASFNVIPR